MCVQSCTTFGVCLAPQKRDSFGGIIIIIKAASSDLRALASTHAAGDSGQCEGYNTPLLHYYTLLHPYYTPITLSHPITLLLHYYTLLHPYYTITPLLQYYTPITPLAITLLHRSLWLRLGLGFGQNDPRHSRTLGSG